jgi:hypothetical protein
MHWTNLVPGLILATCMKMKTLRNPSSWHLYCSCQSQRKALQAVQRMLALPVST